MGYWGAFPPKNKTPRKILRCVFGYRIQCKSWFCHQIWSSLMASTSYRLSNLRGQNGQKGMIVPYTEFIINLFVQSSWTFNTKHQWHLLQLSPYLGATTFFGLSKILFEIGLCHPKNWFNHSTCNNVKGIGSSIRLKLYPFFGDFLN